MWQLLRLVLHILHAYQLVPLQRTPKIKHIMDMQLNGDEQWSGNSDVSELAEVSFINKSSLEMPWNEFDVVTSADSTVFFYQKATISALYMLHLTTPSFRYRTKPWAKYHDLPLQHLWKWEIWYATVVAYPWYVWFLEYVVMVRVDMHAGCVIAIWAVVICYCLLVPDSSPSSMLYTSGQM
jgi:hypothetical protein